jgi:hypothetical protein
MAKRFGLLAAVAIASGMLAACSNPTAPAAAPSTHNASHMSAGVLSGSDT